MANIVGQITSTGVQLRHRNEATVIFLCSMTSNMGIASRYFVQLGRQDLIDEKRLLHSAQLTVYSRRSGHLAHTKLVTVDIIMEDIIKVVLYKVNRKP